MDNEFKFYTDGLSTIETKSADGVDEHYVEGFASTTDLDLVNDIITPEALKSMCEQLKNKNIKVDVEHEAWVKGGSPNIVPIGRVVDAQVKDVDGHKRLWVRVKMNSATSRFSEVWGSIKGGFLDAFSIAYNGVKAVERNINGITARVISDLNLLNIALTGNPANPSCRLTAVMGKSLEFAEITQEAKSMTDENQNQAPEAEVKSEPVAEAAAPAAEVKAVTKEDLAALEQQVAELKSVEVKNAELEKQLADKDAQLKALNDALNTLQLKERPEAESKAATPETKMVGPLDFFGRR